MRTARAWLIVGDPLTFDGEECPRCGFDSLLSFPIHMLTAEGVTEFGAVKACPRCFDEEDA